MAAQPQFSPNKRPKTLTGNPDSSSLMSKGKSKIDEGLLPPNQRETEDGSADCCGICLLELGDGGVSRGYIDCCNHHFCFVCIMEWAKVESRCPLCKRRFSTIRRPPKPFIFPCERIFHVPVRDQVCHNSGNGTIGPRDPYSESKCSMCHGVANENLLLLCDLCDSAAHTYCVGLGATVPEGDWYCQDCTFFKEEQLRIEKNIESGGQISWDPMHETPSTDEHVSVYDIVQEPHEYAVRRYRSTYGPLHLPNPRLAVKATNTTNHIDRTRPRSLEIVTEHPTKPNARTLRHCRDLRIDIMRKNWNGFQSGSMQFSSCPDDDNVSRKKPVSSTDACQSCFKEQSSAQCSSYTTDGIRAQEIKKAWKMMDKAKSVTQNLGRSTIACPDSKCNVREINSVKKADYMPSKHPSPDRHQPYSYQNVMKHNGSIIQPHHHQSLGKNSYKQPSSVYGKQELRGHITGDVHFCEGSITCHSSKSQERESSNDVQFRSFLCMKNKVSVRPQCRHHSLGKGSYKQPSSMYGKQELRKHIMEDVNFCEGSITCHSSKHQEPETSNNVQIPSFLCNTSVRKGEKEPGSCDRSLCLSTYVMSYPAIFNADDEGDHQPFSSNTKLKKHMEKIELRKITVDHQKDCDSKSEIQSLVKLNLKLQTEGEKLEVNEFKEIARLATHSILAACGLERPKPSCCSILGFSCSHPDEARLQKVSLMPNCCRECFYIFVKEMVDTVISHKKKTTRLK